ncbi:substrate-binding periplasmic protein [Litorilituus lipolyticus]|uniref:ABC transporter substrate-binding protein n=1 Tax=Litorilituus lipolyticus TaxID=2491017 RepID=A0A502LAB3_9GAMM|nr:ABC transporter substrate-binding protein [Litorilituus lipolyticus]TPH19191.1 ABC transporter substrate-binding protein [Litorilituus lipolyticus]
MRNIRTSLIFIAFSLYSHYVSAQHKDILVYAEQLAPFQFQENDGKLTGLAIDVLNELNRTTVTSTSVQLVSWARAYKEVLETPNSMIISIARTAKRENKFQWIGCIVKTSPSFWGLKSQFKNAQLTFEEIKQYSVAVSRNSNDDNYLKKHNFHHVYRLVYEEKAIEMVFKERVDLFIASKATLPSVTSSLTLDIDDIIAVHQIKDRPTYINFAFNKDSSPELVKLYQNAFAMIVKSGKLQKLQKKWGLVNTNATSQYQAENANRTNSLAHHCET